MSNTETLEQGVTALVEKFCIEAVRALAAIPGSVESALTVTLDPGIVEDVERLGRNLESAFQVFWTLQGQTLDRMEDLAQYQQKPRSIPAEFIPVIRPEALADTVAQLDAATADIIEKGKAKEQAQAGKGALVKRKLQLDGGIKVTEATALMNIQGSGKDATGVVNGQRMNVGTEQLKDAYRRLSSADQRNERTEVESDIAKIDVEIMQANDAWYSAKEAGAKVEAKANLQAALLNFLAGR